MNKAVISALPLLILSSTVSANQPVNTFLAAGASVIDEQRKVNLNLQHYFADQIANGVYNEFGYFDTDSNMSASFSYIDNSDFPDYSENSQSIGGEYFHGNILIGGSVRRHSLELNDNSRSFSQTVAKLGYLINDNLLVTASYNDRIGEGSFMARYSHELNPQGDYIGFSLGTSQDLKNTIISSSYFGKLGGDHYIRLGIDRIDSEDSDITFYSASYYLSKGTSISFSSDFDFAYTFTGQHYFTRSTAINFGYTFDDDDNSEDLFQIGLSSQF